jgi:hypothetical protein
LHRARLALREQLTAYFSASADTDGRPAGDERRHEEAYVRTL